MLMFLHVPPKFNLYHQSTLSTPWETLTRTHSSLKMREPRLGPLAKGHTWGQLLHAQFAGSTITPLTALHLMGETRIGWRPIFSKGRERLYPPFWSLRSPLLGRPSEALKPPSQPMANPHCSTHDMASKFRLDKDGNRDPTTFPDCSNLSSVPRATKIRSFLLPLAF